MSDRKGRGPSSLPPAASTGTLMWGHKEIARPPATPFCSRFRFVKGGAGTISWQNAVHFLWAHLENGANRAPVSRIWACIFQLLPRRGGNIVILFPFLTRSQPQRLRGVSVYSKAPGLRGAYVSSVVFGAAAPQCWLFRHCAWHRCGAHWDGLNSF